LIAKPVLSWAYSIGGFEIGSQPAQHCVAPTAQSLEETLSITTYHLAGDNSVLMYCRRCHDHLGWRKANDWVQQLHRWFFYRGKRTWLENDYSKAEAVDALECA